MNEKKNLFLEKIKNLLNSRKRIFIFFIIVFILGYAGWKILGNNQQSIQYQTAQAEKGTLITTVSASGNITSGNTISITTNATGIINQVYVKNEDIITQGQKIADITLDTDSQQKQAAAWSSYLSAQNTLNSAKAKMNSLQSALFKANQAFVNDKGTTDPDTDDPKYIQERADWLQAESDYNNQAGVINQAQAALGNTWLSYQQVSSSITAPIGGVINNLTISQGSQITGSQTTTSSSNSNSSSTSQSVGTIVAEGGQTQASVNLSEIDATKVKPGQKVTLALDAFPDKTFTGKVASIDTNGTVSSGVINYPAIIILDTAEKNMYPNMNANAKIITSVTDNVILIPSAAVQTTNNQSMVRVLKNGQIDQVTVEIDDSNDTQTEITSGLNEGDMVVTGVLNATNSSQGQTGGSPFSSFGGGRNFSGGSVRTSR